MPSRKGAPEARENTWFAHSRTVGRLDAESAGLWGIAVDVDQGETATRATLHQHGVDRVRRHSGKDFEMNGRAGFRPVQPRRPDRDGCGGVGVGEATGQSQRHASEVASPV